MLTKNLYFSILLIFLVITNAASWHSLFWGLIFGLGYLIWHSYLAGRLIFKKETAGGQIMLGSLVLLSFLSLAGALIYFLYKITAPIIDLLLILTPLLIFIGEYYFSRQAPKNYLNSLLNNVGRWLNFYAKIKDFFFQLKHQKKNLLLHVVRDSGLIAAYILFLLISWATVLTHTTGEAINSLWDALPLNFLLAYFLGTIILLIIVSIKKQRPINLFLVALHFFSTLSLAVIIYQIGYGFDPFIHQAAEKVIAAVGVITPKTPYYIGQYSLVVVLGQLLQVPVAIIDKFILPVLFSIFVPYLIFWAYRQIDQKDLVVISGQKNEQAHFYYLLPLTFLIIPFTDFITTTPQGLANFLALAVIFLSLPVIAGKLNYRFGYLLFFLSSTAAFIHPLTGIPLTFFSLIILTATYNFRQNYWKKILLPLLFVISLVSLPAIFWLQSLTMPHIANPLTLNNLNWETLKNIIQPIGLIWDNKFNLAQDYLHFFGQNIKWLLLLLAGIGGYLTYQKNKERKYFIYPLFFLTLIAEYLLLKIFVSFQSVINYEQSDYALRVFNLSFYFLLPLSLYALLQLAEKLKQQKLPARLFFITVLSLIISSSLYLSYPYDDAYQIGHYYSTSVSDIKTVNYINDNTTGDYLVLANQSVSAAALKELGFKKYFKTAQGELFFYPLPTSSPLYAYYLDIVYRPPTKETINKAMDLAGVNQAYLVINNYWTDAAKIIPQLLPLADNWQEIDGGKNYIFYFHK